MRGLALLFWAVTLPAFCLPATGQSVQARISSATIGTEEALMYSLEITGADPNQITVPSPPDATGLQALSQIPSQSTNISWVNGNVTQSITYSWRYQPLEEGEARIEPAEVEVGGTLFTSEPITITVVPQSQRPRPPARRSVFDVLSDPFPDTQTEEIGERDVFIRVTPSTTQPFVNEQVLVSYELFFREGMQPRNSRLADSWDAEGFWREDIPIEGRPMPRTSIENGIRYNSILVKRVAVFPTRSGTLTIDPLRISTEVFAPGAFGFGNSLFGRRSAYQEIVRSSPPVTIEATPLPADAPDEYRDAVGQYTMEAQLNRSDTEIGEPLELVVRISGAGNIATLEGPEVRLPGSFEQYEPEVTTRNESTATLAQGTKTYSYVMIPRANGEYTIPPLRFAYLDPASATYRVLERPLPTIRVSGVVPAVAPTSRLASGFPVDDIAGPLRPERWVPYPPTPLHHRWWLYTAVGMPLLFLAALAVWQRRVSRLQRDVAWARGRKAHPLARRHLKQAMALYQADERRLLFEELERAVLGFVGNRLNIAELGLTRSSLDTTLADAGMSASTRTRVADFLTACDEGRFAPENPERARMDMAMQGASELIVLLHERLRA